MPHMRLFQSMETVNITFLYLLLRRAEYLGHENSAFCDSSVVAENIYVRTVVCLDCNFAGAFLKLTSSAFAAHEN